MTRATVLPAVLAAVTVVDGARIAKRSKEPLLSGPSPFIVNGTDAEPCVWKWQVGLYNTWEWSPLCGATLISPTWVVTAKHCVENSNTYAVMAGSLLPGQGERRTSKRVIRKPDTDMALIELSEPFTLGDCINVPALPSSEVPTGTRCWITGWGQTGANSPAPTTLQQAKTTVVGYSECYSQMNGGINQSDVCVLGNYLGKPTSGCYGDSGGPLVCEIDGAMTLFGATSWGYSCRGITVYDGVYSAMDWINQYAFAAPTPAPPPGTWAVFGSGCEEDGNCVQSKNHPGNYGNNEACSIQLAGSVSITVESFSTESSYDFLTMGGRSYSGSSGPSSGSYTGDISWASDYSVTSSGWRLCRS